MLPTRWPWPSSHAQIFQEVSTLLDNFATWLRSRYVKCVDGDLRTLAVALPLLGISVLGVVDLALKSPLFVGVTVGYLALSVLFWRFVGAEKQRELALMLALVAVGVVGVVGFVVSEPISACLAFVLVALPVYFTRDPVTPRRRVCDVDATVERFVRDCLTDEGLRWAVSTWGRRQR